MIYCPFKRSRIQDSSFVKTIYNFSVNSKTGDIMPSKSKTKGNAWELEVAKFLSDLYKESFIRIPSSGAFVGGKNNFRKTQIDAAQLQGKKGDIHPPADWKYWNIECK